MVSGHLGRSVLQDHVHGFNEPATAGEFETDLIKMLLVERLEKGTNGSFFFEHELFLFKHELRNPEQAAQMHPLSPILSGYLEAK